MPSFTYRDLTLSVSIFGSDIRVQLRTLDIKVTKDQMAAIVYPTFDAQEKALHLAPLPPKNLET